ncbi:MAG: cupredoxin family copper-binding protein [Nanoarchaeota archaeon]
MRTNKSSIKIILALFLILFIAACAQQAEEQSSAVEAQDTALIEISNFQFVPGTATIKRGGTVTWVQKDSVAHTIAIKDLQTSSLLNEGEQWNFTFDKTGSYSYICSIHPSMKGKIIVK